MPGAPDGTVIVQPRKKALVAARRLLDVLNNDERRRLVAMHRHHGQAPAKENRLTTSVQRPLNPGAPLSQTPAFAQVRQIRW
jgi:hypothetical protein